MTLRSKITLGFVLGGVLIFTSLVSSHISTSKFIEGNQWMVHTVDVRSEIQNLSRLIITAQNSIRAYHMTEQQYYRDLYEKAKEDSIRGMERLRYLTMDNQIQQGHLDRAVEMIGKKIALWEQSFQLRKAGGLAAIQARLLGSDSKNRDTLLFEAVDALKKEEDRLFFSHIEKVQVLGRLTQLIVSLGGILACLLIGAAAIIVFRDNRRRELAEEEVDRFFTLSLDLLCISGMDGYFKRLSPSYAETLGYSLVELYSKPIVDFVHPEDVERTNREIELQLDGKKSSLF